MSGHLPECRPIIERRNGFEWLLGWRCAPGCPVRRRMFSPVENARMAAKLWRKGRI